MSRHATPSGRGHGALPVARPGDWYRYFTREDAGRIADPQLSMGMVRLEFSRHLGDDGSLPAAVPPVGGGTGFAISARGHILTNDHLATSEIGNHRREAGSISVEVPWSNAEGSSFGASCRTRT